MEIRCPDCGAAYTVSEQKIPGRDAKAVCRKCSATITIRGSSEGKQAEPKTSAPDRSIRPADKLSKFSVLSLSPKYPRYRDPLIIIAVAVVFVGVLAGVHVVSKGAKSTIEGLMQDPMAYIANLILGSDKYGLCTAFLDRNTAKLAILGKNLKYYPIKEAVKTRNGRKTAAVVVRVQGTRATKDVVFQLQDRKGKWEIVSVVMDLGRGEQQTLYP